jgi:hypothetical protein
MIQQWTCGGDVPQQKFAKAVPSTVTPAPAPAPSPSPTPSGGTAGPTITTFTPSGPINLISGQTVTGLHITSSSGPCIQGSGVSNVRIYNNKIGPCGPEWNGVGIYVANNAHDITIDHNSFDDVASAFSAYLSTNNLIFDHNYATRIRGPRNGGNLVLFDNVNGSGNKISCNVSDQTSPAYGNALEDHINPWASSGTAASPILIQYNKLRGGGPSISGSGVMVGDGGNSYTTVDSNIIVNSGSIGIGIAGGHNNRMLNNKIYSSSFPWGGVGAYVWLWSPTEPACYGHEVSGNRVNFTDKNGAANNWWDGANCGAITMSGNIFGDPTITANIWNDPIPQCG